MADNKHKTFKEQIEALPPEFLIALEKYKELHFQDTLAYIFLLLGSENDFFKLSEERQSELLELFISLHYWGFYGGVSFALDPDQEYEVKYSDPEFVKSIMKLKKNKQQNKSN